MEKDASHNHRRRSIDELVRDVSLDFGKATVREMTETATFGPFVPVEPTSSLLDVLLILGKFGVHRVPVVEPGKDIVNIITQVC